MTSEITNLDDWLQFGISRGWITPIFCKSHDLTPMTDLEHQEFDAGFDPCIPTIRINPEGTQL